MKTAAQQTLKTIVVEDEPMALEVVIDYIQKVSALELIGTFRNGIEALSFLQSNEVELMFLDINMPDLTGMELAKSLNDPPMIIFTTAYSEYAIEGFNVMAVDYLLKPIEFVRFLKACNKAISMTQNKESYLTTDVGSTDNYLMVKSGTETHKVLFENILYIEGNGNYVTYYTENGKLMSLHTMKELELTLPKAFIRVHKSYIINLSKLKSYESHQIKIADSKIPLSQAYKSEFLRRLD